MTTFRAKILAAVCAAWLLPAPPAPGARPERSGQPFTTFTIVARDAATGEVGVATCSRAPAAGAVVPWARAGVGAAAAQAWATGSMGTRLLDLMAQGLGPREAMAALLQDDPEAERRQLGAVSASGASASHTGRQTLAFAGAIEEPDLAVLGNLLAGRQTLEAMERSFRSADGRALPLAERLLRALEAGQSAGGDRRGSRSAALVTAGGAGQAGGGVNLRVDDGERPVEQLRRIYDARVGRLGYRPLARPEGGDVRELQLLLKRAGFYGKEPDGRFDDATVAAVQAFRRSLGMYAGEPGEEIGLVDAELIARLRARVEPPPAPRKSKP